jgi:hypothetical protein
MNAAVMLKDFHLRCRHGTSVVETVALGSETVIVFTGDWLVEVLLENLKKMVIYKKKKKKK